MNQPTQTSTKPPAPKNNLKWLLIVLGIVIIAAVLYFCFYIRKPGSSTPSTNPSAATTTNNWQAYTNVTYDYSIKFPKEYYYYVVPSNYYSDKDKFLSIDKTPFKADEEDHYLINIVSGAKTDLDKRLQGAQRVNSKKKMSEVSEITFAGEKAIKDIGTVPIIQNKYTTSITLNHQENGFTILWNNTDANGTHDVIIDQILNTFQFTPSTPESGLITKAPEEILPNTSLFQTNYTLRKIVTGEEGKTEWINSTYYYCRNCQGSYEILDNKDLTNTKLPKYIVIQALEFNRTVDATGFYTDRVTESQNNIKKNKVDTSSIGSNCFGYTGTINSLYCQNKNIIVFLNAINNQNNQLTEKDFLDSSGNLMKAALENITK